MSKVEKLIKYLAIAFAGVLIVFIFLGAINGIMYLTNIFTKGNTFEKENIFTSIKELDIDVYSANITIKQSDSFKVITSNKYISHKEENGKLYITERKHTWFKNSKDSELTIYVPSNFIFDNVVLSSGAGSVIINKLSTNLLYLDLGAGSIDINNLMVYSKAKIDGGAGAITINDGYINNLDLDLGVGKSFISASIHGSSDIDCGVGKMDLNLIGDSSIYKIKVDKGLGSFTVAGEKVKDDTYYGNGENIINIDGGIGSINVGFIESN